MLSFKITHHTRDCLSEDQKSIQYKIIKQIILSLSASEAELVADAPCPKIGRIILQIFGSNGSFLFSIKVLEFVLPMFCCSLD